MKELIIAIVALVLVLFSSILTAYIMVKRNGDICAQDREDNGDVRLDEICTKYLELTNYD